MRGPHRRRPRGERRRRRFPFALAAAVATGGLAVAFRSVPLPWLLAYLVAVNLVTVALYGYDKAAAPRARSWPRVPERLLHVLALAGGTPAAWAAGRAFRHKTLKHRFRRTFWSIAALQAALIGWALWHWGRR